MKLSTTLRASRPLRLAFLVVSALLYLASSRPLAAQPDGGIPTTSGGTTSGATRITGRESTLQGEFMMDVNIWGFVRSPGKYTVPISTRLVDLISLAGGPAERAELEEVKVVHDLNIDSTIVQTVSMFSVEEYQNTGSPESNPVLYPNDTVIIPGDSLNSFNEILSIVSNIAVVTLSIIGLIFAFKKN